jgi:GTP-binding protein
LARTSAAPGKTRLANVYRVARGTAQPFYLVDLPGYGYARGGAAAAREFEALTASLFGQVGQVGRVRQVGESRTSPPALPAQPAPPAELSALLIVDTRHPGLDSDRRAWRWMMETVATRAIVATKIDKLASGQRIRALAELESVFDAPVAAVSAATGEGLNQLWKLIARLTQPINSR